jgi:cobalamin biosynthesis protein CobW
MNNLKKIPTTILTGFLGAGKTTFIEKIVKKSNANIALIINEFGDLGVDADILKECINSNCAPENIIELSNGCICCTVSDDFIPTIEKIVNSPTPPDHIIIETSGLALPKPLIDAFKWPDIRNRIMYNGTIVIVDSYAYNNVYETFEKHNSTHKDSDNKMLNTSIEEVFNDQILSSDLIIINKIELATELEIKKIENNINELTSKSIPIIKSNKDYDLDEIILGPKTLTLDNNIYNTPDLEKDFTSKNDHDHHHDHDHDHDNFHTFSVNIPNTFTKEIILNKLNKVLQSKDILRIKGFVLTVESDMLLTVQVVGKNIQTYYQDSEIKNRDSGYLIFIGYKNINETSVKKLFLK